ncbi:hypothetical protein BSN85_12065 [Bradyrhizobium brasilense]|uniref:hypothetical protein n=1 Tax=Bradyrhizobium brasilense TaxID=1419277 RepID=UPI0009761A49|nr:hypothetical protein [Bradyrhizobium brasilense]OMI11559.1 hypothetical protein BSN85_12065 [Bradyrhizobium brasilense]
MKAVDQPELLLQIGNNKIKLLAKGKEAINAARIGLSILLTCVAISLLVVAAASYQNLPSAVVRLAKLF